MSRRHSDSKRRHSRFDPPPSPKRYRRDAYGKEEKERVVNSANVQNGDHRRLNEDDPPSAKQQSASLHNKPNDRHEPHPTQHEKRGSTGQVGQSSGQRKAGERGWWKDTRKQLNERAETSHCREQRDEKSQAKPDDNTFHRREDFSERKNDPLPTSRKRPAFMEKRIPVESEDANPVTAVAVKSSEIDYPPGRNDRKKEERSINPHHLGRPEKPFADDRAPNKFGARRDGFPSRGRRYGGNDSYRGRDQFNGRQGYRLDRIQTEKWKHDLYQEVTKDPIPPNEDDQIAKLEALLAS